MWGFGLLAWGCCGSGGVGFGAPGSREKTDLSAALKNPVKLRLWLRLVCILMKLVTSSGNF